MMLLPDRVDLLAPEHYQMGKATYLLLSATVSLLLSSDWSLPAYPSARFDHRLIGVEQSFLVGRILFLGWFSPVRCRYQAHSAEQR
nr:MAG TPA: hypothetical protein [Caudoviricetes sp.]